MQKITTPIAVIIDKFRPKPSSNSLFSNPFISRVILAEIFLFPTLITSNLASYFDVVSVSNPWVLLLLFRMPQVQNMSP